MSGRSLRVDEFRTAKVEERLDYSKTPPNVCFRIQLEPPLRASEELSRLLAARLEDRIGSVQKKWAWFLHPWAAELRIGYRSFTVALTKSNHVQGEWIILIGSNDVPFRWMRGHKMAEYVPQLKSICREIHALLTETAGITDVRWYFMGSTAAVANPDELSWAGE